MADRSSNEGPVFDEHSRIETGVAVNENFGRPQVFIRIVVIEREGKERIETRRFLDADAAEEMAHAILGHVVWLRQHGHGGPNPDPLDR